MAGGNGGAATPFWHRGCSARLCEGRRVEREGGNTSWRSKWGGGELGRRGRSSGATSARAASRSRARRAAVMAGSGHSEEGWGRRSGDGTGRAARSSWKAMSGAQRASGRRATLLHSWVNGGRRCVVVAERPSGLRRVRSGAEALMAGLGSQRGGRRRWRRDGAAAAAAA